MVREKGEGAAFGRLQRAGCWKEAEWGCPVGKGLLVGPGSAKQRKSQASFWELAEEGRGGAGLEAFPLPRERAPGCSWLLAGASNLAAAGDLDAWHS